MVQPARCARLLFEPAKRVRVVHRVPKELDRHPSTELQVARDDDPAHPSTAELFLDREALLQLAAWVPGRVLPDGFVHCVPLVTVLRAPGRVNRDQPSSTGWTARTRRRDA